MTTPPAPPLLPASPRSARRETGSARSYKGLRATYASTYMRQRERENLHACMLAWMDVCMYACTMDGWTDGWMDGWMDVDMCVCI